MSLLHYDELPEAGVNDVLAVEGHWLGRHFRVNARQNSYQSPHAKKPANSAGFILTTLAYYTPSISLAARSSISLIFLICSGVLDALFDA